MAELTKEWLEQVISGTEAIRDEIPGGFDADEENTLAALKFVLAVLTAEPVLYCMEGDTLDEENVSTSKAVVDSWVEEWNGEGRCPGEPVYKTVSLYRLPEIK